MSQITRTTNDLIISALRLINILPIDQDVDQSKITEGLESLNMLLDMFQKGGVYIPFRKDITFDINPGVNSYNFGYYPSGSVVSSDTLVQVDFCELINNDIISPIKILNSYEQYYQELQNYSDSLPRLVYFQRQPEYTTLNFAGTPTQSAQCKVRGKIALTHLSKQQELSSIPPYAHRFLKYAIARELKSIYRSGTWGQVEEDEYKNMYDDFKSSNDLDLMSRAPNAMNTRVYSIQGNYNE